MALTDLPLAELLTRAPGVSEPADFEEFWRRTVAATRRRPLDLRCVPFGTGLRLVECFDVSFTSLGGATIRAWLAVPAGTSGPLPTVVEFLGYSNGRGFATSNTLFAQAGWAQLTVDTRGQGWARGGVTPTIDATDDDAPRGMAYTPGRLTDGIDDPETYYYRRVFADTLRSLDAVAALELTDAERTIVTGSSQGGGMTIACAGLAAMTGTPLLGAAPRVPFLCDFPRMIEVGGEKPVTELTDFLGVWRDSAETALRTLNLHDVAHFAARADVTSLWSLAVMDPIVPPSTQFAAYTAWGGEKERVIYPHSDHDGGGEYFEQELLTWCHAQFDPRRNGAEVTAGPAPRR